MSLITTICFSFRFSSYSLLESFSQIDEEQVVRKFSSRMGTNLLSPSQILLFFVFQNYCKHCLFKPLLLVLEEGDLTRVCKGLI